MKFRLKVVTQSELDLAGIAGASDASERRRAETGTEIPEIHVVEGVEELDPELDPLLFGHVEILVQ